MPISKFRKQGGLAIQKILKFVILRKDSGPEIYVQVCYKLLQR